MWYCLSGKGHPGDPRLLGRADLDLLRLVSRPGGEIDFSDPRAALLRPAILGGAGALPREWIEYNKRVQAEFGSVLRRLDEEGSTLDANAVLRWCMARKLVLALQTTTALFDVEVVLSYPWALDGTPEDASQLVMLQDNVNAVVEAWDAHCKALFKSGGGGGTGGGVALVDRIEYAMGRLGGFFVLESDDTRLIGQVPAKGWWDARSGFSVEFATLEPEGWVEAARDHLARIVSDDEEVNKSALEGYVSLSRSAQTHPGSAKTLGVVVAGTDAERGGVTKYFTVKRSALLVDAICIEVAAGDYGVLTECSRTAGKLTGGIGTNLDASFAAHQATVDVLHSELGDAAHDGHGRVGARRGDHRVVVWEDGNELLIPERWLRAALADYWAAETDVGVPFVMVGTEHGDVEYGDDGLVGVWVRWKMRNRHAFLVPNNSVNQRYEGGQWGDRWGKSWEV